MSDHESTVLSKYILTMKMPVGERVVMTSDNFEHIQVELKAHPELTLHYLNDDHGGYDCVAHEDYNPNID